MYLQGSTIQMNTLEEGTSGRIRNVFYTMLKATIPLSLIFTQDRMMKTCTMHLKVSHLEKNNNNE